MPTVNIFCSRTGLHRTKFDRTVFADHARRAFNELARPKLGGFPNSYIVRKPEFFAEGELRDCDVVFEIQVDGRSSGRSVAEKMVDTTEIARLIGVRLENLGYNCCIVGVTIRYTDCVQGRYSGDSKPGHYLAS